MLDVFADMGIYNERQYEAYRERYQDNENAIAKAEGRKPRTLSREYIEGEVAADLMCETMGSSDLLKMFNDKASDEDRNFIAKFFGRIAEGIKKQFNSKDEFPNKFADIIGMFEEAVKNKETNTVAERRFALDNSGDEGYNDDTQNLGGVNDGDTGRDDGEVQRLSRGNERILSKENDNGKRKNGYRNGEYQIRYQELSAYEKSRVSEILYGTIEKSDVWRFSLSDFTISEATERLYNMIESDSPLIQKIVDDIPEFANAIDETFRFVSRNKSKPKDGKKVSVDASPSGAFDSDGNELSKAQNEMFKDSKIRDKDGNLLVLYHGSRFSDVYEFDMYMGVWLTPEIDYARKFADFEDSNIHSLYANITNPADIGQINGDLTTQRVGKLADALGVKRQKVLLAAKSYLGRRTFDFTRSADFIDIAREVGFDGLKALEGDVETFCVIRSSNQVKDITNKTPSYGGDTRRSLDDNGNLSLDDVLKEKNEKYGTIPKGEKPSRDVSVPKQVDDDKKVSQTVRTVLEAEATPEELVPTIEQLVADGDFSYDVYTDKDAMSDAKRHIKRNGWSSSLNKWFENAENGACKPDTFVIRMKNASGDIVLGGLNFYIEFVCKKETVSRIT